MGVDWEWLLLLPTDRAGCVGDALRTQAPSLEADERWLELRFAWFVAEASDAAGAGLVCAGDVWKDRDFDIDDIDDVVRPCAEALAEGSHGYLRLEADGDPLGAWFGPNGFRTAHVERLAPPDAWPTDHVVAVIDLGAVRDPEALPEQLQALGGRRAMEALAQARGREDVARSRLVIGLGARNVVEVVEALGPIVRHRDVVGWSPDCIVTCRVDEDGVATWTMAQHDERTTIQPFQGRPRRPEPTPAPPAPRHLQVLPPAPGSFAVPDGLWAPLEAARAAAVERGDRHADAVHLLQALLASSRGAQAARSAGVDAQELVGAADGLAKRKAAPFAGDDVVLRSLLHRLSYRRVLRGADALRLLGTTFPVGQAFRDLGVDPEALAAAWEAADDDGSDAPLPSA